MLVSIDHVNLVVHDLDRMVNFYTRVLELTVTKRVTISGEWIDQTVGLQNVVADVVYLDLPQGPRIELIRYQSPRSAPMADQPPNLPGPRHIAFRVGDIDAAASRLKAEHVELLSDVQTVPRS